MPQTVYPFEFSEEDNSLVRGTLELEDPVPYSIPLHSAGLCRKGRILLDGYKDLDIALYHNQASSAFIYLRKCTPDINLLTTIGLAPQELDNVATLDLPGQLCMGSDRSKLIGSAVEAVFSSPDLRSVITSFQQHNLAVFPIAREGLKYQVAEAIFNNYGYYCDEIILDAHHVFDSSVPVYNRKVEMTLFKDKDLDQLQRENIRVAFIADSIASGLVMKEVITRIQERFNLISHIEIIAPLATIRGLCRLARAKYSPGLSLRVHVFETLLNALPPDYYYSAHIDDPNLHIRPDLEADYRKWWGSDDQGQAIAETACAGYGWSEVFFSPRKQVQMINGQLGTRHNLTIADIVRRNIAARD